MATQAVKRVLVIAGVGNGGGTGAASARLFANEGYSVAIIARGADNVNKLANEINESGGHAIAFPVPSYSHDDVAAAWRSISSKLPRPEYSVRSAIFNAGSSVWKPFLEVTPQDVQDSLGTSVAAAFAFSREAILTFKENEIDALGKRGTLIFTGATASLRGNVSTSVFAAGKFAARALSQSLAKEFGKDNIHVAHAIIDGGILTDRSYGSRGDEWVNNPNVRLNPRSIAAAYWYLNNQDRSSWTWELDLRPAHEKW